jgi:hypothetical protein
MCLSVVACDSHSYATRLDCYKATVDVILEAVERCSIRQLQAYIEHIGGCIECVRHETAIIDMLCTMLYYAVHSLW